MLPDFPKIKEKFREGINQYLKGLVRQEPLFSQMKEVPVFEGNRMASRTENGILDQSSYEEISGEYSISRQDVIAKGPWAFIENIHKVAEEIKKQRAGLFFRKLEQVTDKTGNIINGKGQPFTFDLFIKSLEKVQIDFDDEEKPYLPAFVFAPEMAAQVKQKLPEWFANAEYKKRFDELIERKREEWRDRESNRKLVD